MDPLSRLPLECLEYLLEILSFTSNPNDKSSVAALASLLRVNRHIATVAMPFLYRYAFRVKLIPGVIKNSRNLVTTLLNCIPPSRIHSILLNELEINNPRPDSAYPFQFEYIKHIRHINITQTAFFEVRADDLIVEYGECSSDRLRLIIEQDLLEKYREERKDICCFQHHSAQRQLIDYYPNVLYREAVWSLADSTFEQLELIAFPLSDIQRYISVVSRLSRLEHVIIVQDLVFKWFCCVGDMEEPARLRKEKALGDVAQFITDHQRHFPGTLKLVESTSNQFWDVGSPIGCGPDIKWMVTQLLPPHKPQYITYLNWSQIMRHRDEVDLSYVREIKSLIPAVVDGQLLQQCRALKSINMHSLVPGCFDWAVREKKENEKCLLAQHDGSSSIAQSPYVHTLHKLVPFAYLSLREHIVSSSLLDDIVYSFSQSLYAIQIDNIFADENAQAIDFGHGWGELPYLERINLKAPEHKLSLDPRFLANCPSLSGGKIIDETFEYSRKMIVPWQPARLNRLRILYLKGLSALSFNPATLTSIHTLLVLKLCMSRFEGNCFIPNIEELNQPYHGESIRDTSEDLKATASEATENEDTSLQMASSSIFCQPQWTWDWFLPNLLHLKLTSEFAYRFQFRMLFRCPALRTLDLNMRTADSHPQHIRTITEEDLCVPKEDGTMVPYIAYGLRGVYMRGQWRFSNQHVLSQFLGTTCLHLEKFTARGWKWDEETNVATMVSAIRKYDGKIRMVRSDLEGPLSVVEEDALGMYPRSADRRKGPKTLKTRFFCNDKEFVLAKFETMPCDPGNGEECIVK